MYEIYITLKINRFYNNTFVKSKIYGYIENINIVEYYLQILNKNILNRLDNNLFDNLFEKHNNFKKIVNDINNDIDKLVKYDTLQNIIYIYENNIHHIYNILYNYRIQLNNINNEYIEIMNKLLQTYNEFIKENSQKIDELYNYRNV